MSLRHFYSERAGMPVKERNAEVPSEQTVQQARTLGRVAVGQADIIYKNEGKSGEYIVVIIHGDTHTYRDMYKIV